MPWPLPRPMRLRVADCRPSTVDWYLVLRALRPTGRQRQPLLPTNGNVMAGQGASRRLCDPAIAASTSDAAPAPAGTSQTAAAAICTSLHAEPPTLVSGSGPSPAPLADPTDSRHGVLRRPRRECRVRPRHLGRASLLHPRRGHAGMRRHLRSDLWLRLPKPSPHQQALSDQLQCSPRREFGDRA